VNDTLNTFVDDYTSVLNTTFGGTILYDPIMQTLNCLVGLKITSLEKGLTWVHDNAHVTFPEFANDTFSLGAAASIANSSTADSFLASPGSSTTDDVTGAVVKMTDALANGILDEFIIAIVLVGIWFFIVFIGVTRAAIGMLGRDKTRGEGGAEYTGQNRMPLSPRSPNRTANIGDAKFPAFGGPISSVNADGHNGDEAWGMGGLGLNPVVDEKLGHAGQRSVGVRQGHERVSSYGYVAGEEDEKH